MNVSFDFFAAKGITPAKTTNANDFAAANNAWRVVLGMTDGTPEGTTFLATKNYVGDLATFTAPINTAHGVLMMRTSVRPIMASQLGSPLLPRMIIQA